MRIGDYLQLHTELCQAARDLSVLKGHDYSGTEDTLRNLKAPAVYDVVTAEQGLLVRLGDKLSRLWQLVGAREGAAVKDESVRDTILDLINYACLLAALIEDGRQR